MNLHLPVKCSGCGGFADRRWVFDSTRGICTRCAQTIQCVDRTESLPSRKNSHCLSCGDTTYHGFHMCSWCLENMLANMEHMWGPEIFYDNPFIFWLQEPRMLFGATLGLEHLETGFDWVQIWLNEHWESGVQVIHSGNRYVGFAGLYEKIKSKLDTQ